MTASIVLICVLCGQEYHAPAHAIGDYGLCPDHWSPDTLPEWDRIEVARRHALRCGSPATLTLCASHS
jgi:hypothetical protein